MISETTKGLLISTFANISFNYGATAFHPEVLRGYEDYPRKNPFIVIEFFPTSSPIMPSQNNCWIGSRTNPSYSDYAYGEEEICNIKACVKSTNNIHGRILAHHFLERIEKYIRGKWQSLINGEGFIKQHTFTPYRNVPSVLTENQYVYEMEFSIVSQRGWSDEPEVDAQVIDNITGVSLISGIDIWVNK